MHAVATSSAYKQSPCETSRLQSAAQGMGVSNSRTFSFSTDTESSSLRAVFPHSSMTSSRRLIPLAKVLAHSKNDDGALCQWTD